MLLTTKPLKVNNIDILTTEITNTWIKRNTNKTRLLKTVD